LNILCVIDSLGSGGSQRQLVNIALGLKERGNGVSFLTYHNLPFFNSQIENRDIPVHCIQGTGYLTRIIKMRRFIRAGGYDAVVSYLEAPNFICEIAGFPKRKWRLIVGERSANPGIANSCKLKIYRWFHLLADYVVSNSYANMKMIQSLNPILSHSKCKVIYNSLDCDTWKPSPGYVPRKNGKLKLLVVASHRSVKNLNGLVDALGLLSESERNGIEVEWYGDRQTDPYKDNSFPLLQNKIDLLKLDDTIRFYPATNEILSKVQDADAVGLFSFYEGFPNTVCEGMACGKPVVCSTVSDIPALFSDRHDLLCDPADPHSIASALKKLLNLSNDELHKIGYENLILAKVIFNKEHIIDQYSKLLSR
jgi:glycosyltransferase involved in cell wall biosynthesis